MVSSCGIFSLTLAFTSSDSQFAESRWKRMSTFVSFLLTCCPPAPELKLRIGMYSGVHSCVVNYILAKFKPYKNIPILIQYYIVSVPS